MTQTRQYLPLLEQLKLIAGDLDLPFAVSLYANTPAPSIYLVAMPLSDGFVVFADNQPGVEVEEVRLALFTKGNYLPLRNQVTKTLLQAGLTITGRHYVGFEADTGFHHYSIDVSTYHTY